MVDGEIYVRLISLLQSRHTTVYVYNGTAAQLKRLSRCHYDTIPGLAGTERGSMSEFAYRTELLVNGGFETGDFAGWTAVSNGRDEMTPWTVGPAGGGFFFNSMPREGNFSAYNGFDGEAGLGYDLYQQVTIPEGYDRITLRTNHRIVYNDTTEYWPERELSITVRDTDGQVLGTVYGETLTRSTDGEVDRGWQKHVFDLSQYAGQTVEICFSETVPQDYAGPAMIEFDDISLSAEYLPSWALPDVDEYTLDLTGKAGHAIDVVLAGQDGVEFSGEVLELLDPDGVSVLATAVNDPLGEPAGSFDLGILDFTVPGDGVYTLRVTSWTEGRYGLVVTDAMVFDSESDVFRSLDKTDAALGYLGGQDDVDWYTITMAAGEVWVIHTETPLDGIAAAPRNDLDPGLTIVAPDGQTVAANSASPPDGKNAGICLVAPADGIYRIGVTAESGQGEYLLHAAEGVNVLARRLFYNNSLADGNDPAANEADDQAVATDKRPLLPGETASFANYSSYVWASTA